MEGTKGIIAEKGRQERPENTLLRIRREYQTRPHTPELIRATWQDFLGAKLAMVKILDPTLDIAIPNVPDCGRTQKLIAFFFLLILPIAVYVVINQSISIPNPTTAFVEASTPVPLCNYPYDYTIPAACGACWLRNWACRYDPNNLTPFFDYTCGSPQTNPVCP